MSEADEKLGGITAHSDSTDVEKHVSGTAAGDSAIAVSSAGHDIALDKRVNRKFDLRILPWIFGIW